MRQLTLLLIFSFVSISLMYAQNQLPEKQKLSSSEWQQFKKDSDFRSNTNAGRTSSAVSFPLDYDSLDSRAASNQAGTEYQLAAVEVNNGYQNDDNLTLDWAAVAYDSLYNYQTNTAFDRSNYKIQVDSVLVFLRHENTTGNNDTLVFSIWLNNSLSISGQPPNQTLSGDVHWRDSIITSQSLSPQGFSGFTLPVDTMLPNQGESFTFRGDVLGDRSNTVQFLAGSATSCMDSCGSRSSVIESQIEVNQNNPNSLYYLNFTQQGQNLSGINSLSLPPSACPQSCTELPFQNFVFVPYVTLKDVTSAESATVDKSHEISVAPNPTNGQLTIKSQARDAGKMELSIFNLQGEKVYSDQLQTSNGPINTDLDISSLANGLYLMKVQTENKVYTDKITVTR
ncbi:MAG: hypothetical protein BRD50_00655 [Bacteroidetes bacterium SW_11_45_7]|nr:MAG: hypothetical protein BRD50_00655 [Bacteroidetes bacterium SW_11_45_7]